MTTIIFFKVIKSSDTPSPGTTYGTGWLKIELIFSDSTDFFDKYLPDVSIGVLAYFDREHTLPVSNPIDNWPNIVYTTADQWDILVKDSDGDYVYKEYVQVNEFTTPIIDFLTANEGKEISCSLLLRLIQSLHVWLD